MSSTVQRIVVEIETVVDAAGTVNTHYFSTSGYATLPTDTPANTYIAPRLKSAGNFRRELFSGTRVTGAVRPSFGEIVLHNADGGLDAWLGYGVSGGKVTVRMGDDGDAYPGEYTTIYIAYAQHIVADFAELRIRLRDRLHLLEQPLVTSSFAGTGGLEGSTAMAGKLKQWVSSDPGFFPIILVDAATQLYFVQSTGVSSVKASFKVFEGALEITKGADYPDAATCLSTPPAAGQARFWFGTSDDGPVYVRLGSVPTSDLRVQGFGYQTNGSPWDMPALAALAGITGGSGSVAMGAQLVDDSRTMLQVMVHACASRFAYFGLTRLDSFVCGTFAAPGASASYTFTQHNAKNWRRDPILDMDAPVWSLNVSAGKTWKSALVAGATTANKDYMGRDPWWCTFASKDAAIKTANPGAIAEVIEVSGRDFQNATDQSNFSTAYFALHGVRRDFYTCTVPLTSATIVLDLHDTVEVKLPRFGLSAGKKMRIITQQIDCDRREITYGMWG